MTCIHFNWLIQMFIITQLNILSALTVNFLISDIFAWFVACEHHNCQFFPYLTPVSQAVCCSNEQHCCPAGYNCNDAVQSCVRDGMPWFRLPWRRTTPAMTPKATLPQILLDDSDNKAIQEIPSDVSVVHCDNIYYCPDGTTCCKNPYGVWSCCAQPVVSVNFPFDVLYWCCVSSFNWVLKKHVRVLMKK